jgi:hypothetical protein
MPPDQTTHLVMPHGLAAEPARTLAIACGSSASFHDYDLAALTEALKAGCHCVVVWTGPQTAIAQALRDGIAPSERTQHWLRITEDLLQVFRRFRRRLLLVDAQVLLHADPDAVAALEKRLPLSTPILAPQFQTSPDLATAIASLVASNLTDIAPVWEELQACSICAPAPVLTSHALDPLAAALSATGRNRPDTSAVESRLLRDQLSTVSQALTQSANPTQNGGLAELTLERDLLRAQVQFLTETLSDLQIASDRNHLAADQTTAASHAHAQRNVAEIGLLREQLVFLHSELERSAATQAAPSPDLSAVLTDVEAAIAAMLGDLVAETEGRVSAEQELHATQSALRAMGPQRIAVASRPQA